MAKGRKVTPLLTSKGIFEVDTPFALRAKKVYEVVAIREFDDLWNEHIDVYETYYRPYGLTEADYKRDVSVGAAIVSLLGEDGIHYIPDTYFISYPELGLANYHHVVMSVSLGAMNKNHNVAGLKKEIEELCSKYVGVKAVCRIHTAPVKEAMTQDEAKRVETLRQGNINIPESTTLQLRNEKSKNDAIVANTNRLLLARFASTGRTDTR